MIQKTYQALRFQTYDMYVEVKGKRVLIPFRGGTLRPDIKGTFITSDPDLQKVLDNDTSNGLTFKEVNSFDDEAKPADTEEPTLIRAEGVKTVQEARDYVIANVPGMTANKLPNRTAVEAAALENHIVFPDLPEQK